MGAGMLLLAVLNGVVSLAGIAFGVLAAMRPSALTHEADPGSGERFYATMYAVRAVPLGLLAGVTPFLEHGLVSVLVLLVAAVVQAADAVIGARRRDVRMVAGPAIACLIHVITAFAVSS